MLLSFIVPMTSLILVNTVLMVLVLKSFFELRPVTHKVEIKKTRVFLRAGVSLLPYFAVNWFLGVLALEDAATPIFQYTFTFSNTLQGISLDLGLLDKEPIMINNESRETSSQVPSTYLSLQQPRCPSTFAGDGSQDDQKWLKEYKRVAKFNRWDDTMCLANAVFFLEGTARKWFENNEEALTSWGDFQRALGEAFGQQEEVIKESESLLKNSAQKVKESSETYIRDVLYLCKIVNPRMDDETKLGHLMKGVAEDIYQILIANVAPMAYEEKDLPSLIRRIVQEEIQKVIAQPRPTTDSLEDLIREEVKMNLSPISKRPSILVRNQSIPFRTYESSKITECSSPPTLPKSQQWRTPDDRLLCFHCGRPGHIIRYCRERKQVFADARTRREPRRPTTLGDYMTNIDEIEPRIPPARQPRSASPYQGRWISTGRRPSRSPARVLNPPSTIATKLKNNSVKITIKRTEVLALVDSGADYSVISEDFRRLIKVPMLSSRGPIIKVANSKCVRALGRCILRSSDYCSKALTLDKETIIPASVVSLKHGRSKVWMANGSDLAKIIPAGMKVAEISLIDTRDYAPIKQRPYRVSPRERSIIQTEVDNMLELGIIQPSDSPWSSPVVLVKKKDGSWRFCVDYRRLNKITRKDVYPLPRIDETLDSLRGASIFSTMDLKSGYWQIEVDETDREKTAFVTPDGIFEFKVMPFGLCNTPATFELIMDNLLRGLKWTISGLKLNSEKCSFGANQIEVLGHLIDGDGIYPDPDKVEAVINFPRPENVSEVRSLLGLCSYYRRFIKNFAYIAGALNELLRMGGRFIWTDSQESSFNQLKSALTSEPVLGHFDETAPIYVHTDSSGYGVGSVFRMFGRTLVNQQISTVPVWPPFSIVTDHHSLCWLANLKDPSGRLARWALRLQEYEVTVYYKNGHKHKDVDFLSRSPLPDTSEETEEDIPSLAMVTDVEKEQKLDPSLAKMMKNCDDPNFKRFAIMNKILYKKKHDPLGRRWLLVVPKSLRLEVLRSFHDAPTAGHLGFAKTSLQRLIPHRQTDKPRDEIRHWETCFRFHGREAETMLDTLLPYQPDYENDEYLSQLIIDAEDARQLARLHTIRTQDIDKRRYDSRHRPVYYNVGDLVWIFTPVRKTEILREEETKVAAEAETDPEPRASVPARGRLPAPAGVGGAMLLQDQTLAAPVQPAFSRFYLHRGKSTFR
ncbi:hypothetical protein LAZ67_2002611 [Cordylochernes scorpioides]|uniref:RNA-directed DNA polymerase n=1 Tax=Cordylochernes scorpioides TaxID=51811 RepID=A0ABY6K245_9ARAC|nr:hypothetical protein LAZ67_2002611 [Cordylochernes scorpioides]